MNTKDHNIKIEFFNLIKNGTKVNVAAQKVNISLKTAYVWNKSWKITHVNTLKAYEILSKKLLDSVNKIDLSAYEIKKLSKALINIEKSPFIYKEQIIEKKNQKKQYENMD